MVSNGKLATEKNISVQLRGNRGSGALKGPSGGLHFIPYFTKCLPCDSTLLPGHIVQLEILPDESYLKDWTLTY